MHPLDIGIIAFYFCVLIAIGIWTARKIKHSSDFLVSGRSLGKFLSTMLGLGAATSTDQTISVVAQAYRTGLSGIWFQWLYLFGTVTAWLLAPVCRRARVHTAAEFYRLRYSQAFSVFYAIIGITILVMIIGIMLLAMGETIEAVTGGVLSKSVVIIGMAAVFLTYGTLGGLKAAAIIDSIQGLLILFLSFGMIPFILYKVGGFEGLHQTLDPGMFSLAAPREMTLFVVVVFSIQAIIGTPGSPNVIPAFSASKTEMDARVGTAVAGVLKRLCSIGWVLVGIGAFALFGGTLALKDADQAFGMAVRNLLPPGLMGLMLAAMFAAVLSTCDALMVFAAGLFVKDVLPVLNRGKSSMHEITASRLASFAVVVTGIFAAYLIPNIRMGFVYIWQFTLFACFPFWCGVAWKRGTSLGAWASVVGTFGIWLALELGFSSRVADQYFLKAMEFVVCIIAGFVLYIVFSLCSKPENPRKLNNFYKRLTTPVGQYPELDKT